MIKNLQQKIQVLISYDRSVKLFLIIPIFYGLHFAVKTLFFNFYILSLGFDKAYLGLANGTTAAAALVFAFPLGVLTDRIGRKRSSLFGLALMSVGFLAFLLTGDKIMILVMLFLSGVGDTLWTVASIPLLTRLTTPLNRVTVFSLQAALFTFSGVVGNVLGGQMPSWLERISNIQPGTIFSYRGILLSSFGMLLITLIPILMIPRGDGEAVVQPDQQTPGEKSHLWKNLKNILRKIIIWQLFLPNFLIGLGAALMVPYLNLFLVEKFSISEQLLGTLFSIAALVTGTGTLFSPWIARRLNSRIRALVLTQGTSLFFLLLLGFSPWLGMAVVGFWGRNALMNMAQPLYNAFSMEQVADHEQGTLNSMLSLSWQIGWVVMPVFSGFIQENYGFSPIFIATSLLYALSTLMIWAFFKNSERSMANQIPATLI